MLSHGWTYQHLIHDVLNMKLNRITIETPVDESNPAKGVTRKAYDLTANDFFWTKNSGLPFQEVAEDIDAELNRYKEESAAITKKTGVTDLEDLQNDTSASAQHLKAALTVLPELRERKVTLDMHMNILAAILSAIQKRALNVSIREPGPVVAICWSLLTFTTGILFDRIECHETDEASDPGTHQRQGEGRHPDRQAATLHRVVPQHRSRHRQGRLATI